MLRPGCKVFLQLPNMPGRQWYTYLANDVSGRFIFAYEVGEEQRIRRESGRADKQQPLLRLLALPASLITNELNKSTTRRKDRVPAWKDSVTDKDYDANQPKRRYNYRWGNRLKIRQVRYEKLQPVHRVLPDIFSAPDPNAALNTELAKRRLNPTRYRRLVVECIVSGENMNAFLPNWSNCGAPGVRKPAGTRPRGRPPSRYLDGTPSKQSANADKKMIRYIIQSYMAHRKVGRSMPEIWRRALRTHFKRPKKPTLGQYKYWVAQEFPTIERRQSAMTFKDWDEHEGPDAGRISDSIHFGGQEVEIDATGAKRKIVAVAERTRELRSMYIARAVCRKTSMVLGLGFSLTGEHGDLYRSLLFSMGIDKVLYCSLFGIEITPDQWPCKGYGNYVIADRGPAMQEKLFDIFENLFGEEAFTRSGRGGDKPFVETAHSKKRRRRGRIVSSVPLTAIETVRIEIYQALRRNMSLDISTKVPTRLLEEKRYAPTPLGFWKYLDEEGRIIQKGRELDYLVKTLLTEEVGHVHHDGLHFRGFRYDNADLRRSGLLEKAARRGAVNIPTYFLSYGLGSVFVDTQMSVLHVPMMPPDGDDTYTEFSIDDAKMFREGMRATKRDNATSEAAMAFEAKEDDIERAAAAANRAARKKAQEIVGRGAEGGKRDASTMESAFYETRSKNV